MHRAVMFRITGKCTLLERVLSRLEIENSILDPRSLKLKTGSSRCETQSLKVSRIENRVLHLKNRDASDCQLTFERYCTGHYKRIPPLYLRKKFLATAGNQKYNLEAYNFPLKANEQSKYSWTSLIWTPKGQIKVSVLERCSYKRGHYDDVTSMTALTVLSIQ